MNMTSEKTEFDKRLGSIQHNRRLSRMLPRLWMAGFAISMLSLLLLGIHFFVISQGLFYALILLSPFWSPVRKMFLLISGLPENESPFHAKNFSPGQKTWLILLSLPWLIIGGYGVWLLIKVGFLELNPIYMLLSH
jgi:hypothetical protein